MTMTETQTRRPGHGSERRTIIRWHGPTPPSGSTCFGALDRVCGDSEGTGWHWPALAVMSESPVHAVRHHGVLGRPPPSTRLVKSEFQFRCGVPHCVRT
eukprot:1155156-Rhodomonas_salina.2